MCMAIHWGADIGFMGQAADQFEDALACCHKEGYWPELARRCCDGKGVHKLWGYLPFTYPINLIGHTAASIPTGFSSEGMPIGLHIIGLRGGEEALLAASAAFEQAQPWVNERPPVS